jgi:hypothetical protein
MNRILRSQLPQNSRDLAVFDTTTGSSPGRSRWRIFLLSALLIALSSISNAQVSTYTFAQSTGTYSSITGGTQLYSGNFDDGTTSFPLPFTFTYNNVGYTNVMVATNGHLVFGATDPTGGIWNQSSVISQTFATTGAVAAWAGDLSGWTGTLGGQTSEVRAEVVGSAPNRTFVAQWRCRPAYATSTTAVRWINVQVRLSEGTNVVQIVYGANGNIVGAAAVATTKQIGLRGATNADFNNRTNTTTTLFSSSTAGTLNNSTQAWNAVTSPPGSVPNGLTYTWTPPVPCTGTPSTPVASFSGTSAICSGATKVMSATGFSTGTGLSTQWQVSSTSGGPYINVSGGTGATTASYTTAALTPGTYYYVCTSTCSNSSITSTSNELVLTVNALPTVTFTAPNGGAFCGTQQMTASGASTYVWTPASSLSSNTGTSVYFTGTSNVNVAVTGTDANGCVGASSAQAITYSTPTAITATSSVPNFCGTGGTATITASSAAAYTYTFEALDGAVLSNTTASSVDATIAGTSAIMVTGYDASTGCSSQAFASVGVYPLPSATVTTSASGVCPGTSAIINSGLSAGNFSATSIPYAALVAPGTAVTLVTGGVATPAVTGGLDDGGWGDSPIGFNFNFFGTPYSTINVGTNGTLMFGALNTNGGFATPYGLADFTFTTLPSTGEPFNMIAVLAMDNNFAGADGGTLKYWTTGYSPNRKFVVSYEGVKEYGDTKYSTAQAIFYETTGIVEVHVFSSTNVDRNKLVGINNGDGTVGSLAFASGTVANATNPISTPFAYRFSPPSNYLTTWSATDVNGTTSLTTNVDGSPITVINGFLATVAPLLTTQYSISYANATTGCSNTLSPAQVTMLVLGTVAPQGVNTTSTVTTACPSADIPLATSYTGSLDGLTFQWQVSTDGGASWNPIAGATAATYTATQTVPSSYQVGIASCGGTVTYTTPLPIALTGFLDCYCASNATSTADEEISNVTVGTVLNNSSDCTTLAPGPGSIQSGYSNYTTLTPISLIQDVAYPISVTQTTCGGSWGNIIGAWIDYNHNGLFTDAGEQILLGSYLTGNQTATGNFTVPATSLSGLTRMRVVSVEDAIVDPCGTYAWGETEDYYVNILGPCDPALFTPPLASADDPDATVCGTQTSQLTAFDFNGSANPIYMWYDAAVGGTLLQNSTSNFYTPAPITATTSWYVATNTGTCITDRFPVTLNWLAPASISLTNSTPASCGTTSVATDLAATSSNVDYVYTWNSTPVVGSGITAGTTGASLSGVTPTVNGEYTYTATAFDSATGCTAVATTTVNFYPGPTAPTGVTGGSTCLNGTTLNVSANGAAPAQTLTVELGSNVNLPGAAVGYTLPYGTLSLSGNVSIPAGAIISSANLVVNGLTANGFTWLSDMEVSLSGVSTIANQVFQASNTSPTNGGPYTISASIPTGSGAVTCTFLNTYTGNVTMTSVDLVINYTVPSVPVWFNAATGGSVIGSGSTLNVIGTSYLPDASAPFSGNVYAASVSTIGALTCYSPTVAAPVSVGQPLTVAVAATAPLSVTTTLNANQISINDGTSASVTGSVSIPAGASILSTQLVINGVTSVGSWGTDGTGIDISMSGASTVASQVLTTSFAPLNGSGPFTFAASPITSGGGTVFVNIANNGGWGDVITVDQVQLIVSYNAPVSGSVCPGTPVTLTAVTTGGGANSVYQWNLNGSPISGAVAATYVASPTAATDAFTVSVTDDCNAVAVTSASYFQPLFTVTAGTITGPPAILVNDFTAPIQGAGTWTIAGQNTGSTIQWVYGTAPVAPFTTIAGATSDSQTLFATGGGGTIYLTATTTTLDGCTIQANVVTVTLGNAIDTPCTASPVTVGDQGGLSFSTAAAGVDAGEVFAPASGCDVQDGWCTSSLEGTVWFSFVAPASGHVSVLAPGWDDQLAIYSATDCANYATFTLVNANDDGGGAQGGANFSAFLSDVKCLIPGTTYYIQLDGYSGVGTSTLVITDLGNTAPAITGISANITAPAATGTCAAIVSWATPVAADDQSCVTMTSNIASGTSFNVGATTVTYTATDAQGLVTTASFTVTVSDTQLPSVTAPAAVTVTAALNSCTASAVLGSVNATDNCGILTSTNDAPATFPIGNTTVTYTVTDVNGNVATATQVVTVNINPANLWYVDTDGDGFGAGASLLACSQPAGYVTNNTDCDNAVATTYPGATELCNGVDDNCNTLADDGLTFLNYYADADADGYGTGAATNACAQPTGFVLNNTDCNDANVNINPGAIEICGNTIDDNCNGTSEEGCLNPGENPSNAISMSTSIWPNCNAVNGTLVNATASGSAQTVCLTGEDKWHQFVATSEGISIVVNSSSADILIELQTAAGVLVAQENAVAGIGGEILNHYGLTAGQVYKIGVRNYNSALGTGTYSICAKMLKRGGCDYGPGPYSLCQYFKATWAGAAGTSYTYTFTGISGPASGNVYTRTQNSDICVLSSVLPTLPYGSTYNVLISNTYTINNGAGVAEVITVPGLAPCSMSTATQPVTALRTSDRCTAGPRFRGSIVASLPWVCGTTNWRWEFTELDAQSQPVGLPITVNRGAASNYINLGTVLQLQYGKTYSVRTAPILSYTGTDYQWGTPFCMSIVGSAGMIADGSQAANQAVRVETANEVNMSLYPNPTHGTDVNINLSGVDSDNVQIRVVDAMGRQVWSNRYSVDGILNTNITFERPLANGLYMVEAIFNGEVQTQRMMVQK